MNRILGLTIAALMGAGVVAAPAFAQSLQTGGLANAEAVAGGARPESVDLSDQSYQTGGQHNAQAASKGYVSSRYLRSIFTMDGQDRVYEEYETGGIYNAEKAKSN